MHFFNFILQDWNANRGNSKGRNFLLLFRIANFCANRRLYFYLGAPYLVFYKIIVQWLYALEIPWNVKIGKNFAIYHGQALTINKDVIIGENCTLRQCTTIGTKQNVDGSYSKAPVIGNNVDVGSNTCIIGGIRINDNVKIGCGSVVIKDIDSNCVAAGNPAVEKRRYIDFSAASLAG